MADGTNAKGRYHNVGIGALVLVGLVVAGNWLAPADEPQPAAAIATVPPLTAEQRAGCVKLLRTTPGIAKFRENRIDVEDFTWAASTADEKRFLLALVACATFGKRPNELSDRFISDEFAVAYGNRSGKRLAMLTHDGVFFE